MNSRYDLFSKSHQMKKHRYPDGVQTTLQTRLSGILVYRACPDELANEIANKTLWKNRILQAFELWTALLITILLTELRQQELTRGIS
jgi:hypothetical protein